jgi:mannosyltransferase OCH1-like enzyme
LDFIQTLADIFRLAVLNKYGGIYLDCDTYPLKPFDSLLMTKNFTVARHTYNNIIIPDSFFMGKDVNTEHITTYT